MLAVGTPALLLRFSPPSLLRNVLEARDRRHRPCEACPARGDLPGSVEDFFIRTSSLWSYFQSLL